MANPEGQQRIEDPELAERMAYAEDSHQTQASEIKKEAAQEQIRASWNPPYKPFADALSNSAKHHETMAGRESEKVANAEKLAQWLETETPKLIEDLHKFSGGVFQEDTLTGRLDHLQKMLQQLGIRKKLF